MPWAWCRSCSWSDVGVVEVGVVVVVDPVVVDEDEELPLDEGEELPLDEDDDVVVESEEDGLVPEEDVVSRPLSCSCVWISCCTAATAEATVAGVALPPSSGSALSCLRSAASCAVSSLEGSDFSVTTIWSAIAVVRQAVQL